MQYIEDDMDDLFQRAAADYPLNEGGGDWDGIFEKINDKREEPVLPLFRRNVIYKKLLSLAVLLFFIIDALNVFYNRPVLEDNNLAVEAKDTPGSKKPVQNITIVPPYIIEHGLNSKEAITKSSLIQPKSKNKKKGYLNNAVHTNYVADYGGIWEKESKEEKIFTGYNSLLIFDPASGLYKNKHVVTVLPLVINRQIAEAANFKKEITTVKRPTGFYAGFSLGVDFSKGVAMQFGNSGFEGGVIFGYRFSNSFSVESGINRVKKNYLGRGKDFNMDKVKNAMPAGMVIDDLKSSITVVEVPLKAKYDFHRKAQSAFFIGGGISGYIVTRELNHYNGSVNGQSQKITTMYRNNSYAVPAIGVLSAGYRHTITKNVSLQIEPFLKIPLRGMGVGNMQVTTAGVQLAITSRFK